MHEHEYTWFESQTIDFKNGTELLNFIDIDMIFNRKKEGQ